ncbi:MAG: hypothetical protein VCC04_04465 [Myxococcota bacterium]
MTPLISTSKWLVGLGMGLALGLAPPMASRADGPSEIDTLRSELAGDQAYLAEWLAQPEAEDGVSPMHTDAEIRAVAERMPRTQARLRELEQEAAQAELDQAP